MYCMTLTAFSSHGSRGVGCGVSLFRAHQSQESVHQSQESVHQSQESVYSTLVSATSLTLEPRGCLSLAFNDVAGDCKTLIKINTL